MPHKGAYLLRLAHGAAVVKLRIHSEALVLAGGVAATQALLRRQLRVGWDSRYRRLLEQRLSDSTARLRASEAQLHRIISSVPALVAYVDAQQR